MKLQFRMQEDSYGHCRLLASLLLGAALSGCAISSKKDGPPWRVQEGIMELHARDGRLMTSEVWHDQKLLSAWQYQPRESLPWDVVDAVNRGERDWPPPEWIQTVKNGEGFLYDLDQDGREIGWYYFNRGVLIRAAH